MPTPIYRLMILGCALSWLLVGLHLPAVHAMTLHGEALPRSALAAVSLLAVVAVGVLWTLLRGPAPPRGNG